MSEPGLSANKPLSTINSGQSATCGVIRVYRKLPVTEQRRWAVCLRLFTIACFFSVATHYTKLLEAEAARLMGMKNGSLATQEQRQRQRERQRNDRVAPLDVFRITTNSANTIYGQAG